MLSPWDSIRIELNYRTHPAGVTENCLVWEPEPIPVHIWCQKNCECGHMTVKEKHRREKTDFFHYTIPPQEQLFSFPQPMLQRLRPYHIIRVLFRGSHGLYHSNVPWVFTWLLAHKVSPFLHSLQRFVLCLLPVFPSLPGEIGCLLLGLCYWKRHTNLHPSINAVLPSVGDYIRNTWVTFKTYPHWVPSQPIK